MAAAQGAAPVGSLEGRTQFQLQLGLLDFEKVKVERNEVDRSYDSAIATKNASYGVSSRIGIGLGYGVSDQVQLALFAGFALRKRTTAITLDGERGDDLKVKGSSVQLIPALRYVAGEGAQRFYLGVGLGFEREKEVVLGGGSNTVRKHGLFGGQLGMFCFVHPRVSLDPGLELYYVMGSTKVKTAGDDVANDDNGVRVLLTLGLSLWSAEDEYQPPVGGEPGIDQATQQEPDPALTEYAATRIDDLSLRLLGNPQRSGVELTLGLTTHPADNQARCEVKLLSDQPTEDVQVNWREDMADATGPLQAGSGQARFKVLQRWATNNPSLTVCNRPYPVNPEARAQLQAALARFQTEATAAGTREAEPTPPELQAAPPVPQP